MEVFVKNLPNAMTERQVRKYFEPHLAKLQIHTFHVDKHGNKDFARLTFSDLAKGKRFLEEHGQPQPGKAGFNHVKIKLFHMRKPVNCTQSYNIPDKHVLSSLSEQELRHLARVRIRDPHTATANHPPEAPRVFHVSSISCGQWGYSERKPVFRCHFHAKVRGQILFGRRAVVVILNPSDQFGAEKQIQMRFESIESVVTGDPENSSPSISFSLAEAPRLYEKISQNELLAQALQAVSLGRRVSHTSYNPIKRKRVSALNETHGRVVASCLCYRVTLLDRHDIRAVKALNRIQELPPSVAFNTAVHYDPAHSFPAQMTSLNNALTGGKFTQIPFGAKFQLQKLAQNGYLPPSRVVDFMSVVKSLSKGVSWSITTRAIHRIFDQIPYAGPATDASELSLGTLSDLLTENIKSLIKEESYSKGLAEQPEHIAQIFKAVVTPTGTYLYGPEPEMKNRVLRKYSSYTDNFLQVRFLDENLEQIWYDRVTSNEEIYHQRFKGVLHSTINIAGRGYEVRVQYSIIRVSPFPLNEY